MGMVSLLAERDVTVSKGVKLKRFRIFIFIFIFLSIVCTQLVIAQDKGFYLNDIVSADQVQKQSGLITLENIYEFIDYGETLEEKLFVSDDSKIFVKNTDILSITIGDVAFHPPDMEIHRVIIKLDDSIADDISSFFQKRLSKSVALIIGKKVFAIGDVLEPVSTEFAITVFGRTKQQIKSELSKICKNIKIE